MDATHSRDRGGARAPGAGALAANRKCVRANVLLGDLHAAAGDHEGAIEAWKRIEQQQPAYLALVAGRLLESFRALGRVDEGLTLLRGYLAQLSVARSARRRVPVRRSTNAAPRRPTGW